MKQNADNLVSNIRSKLPESSPTNRKATRANAFFELTRSVTERLGFGLAQIPVKTMQTLISSYTAIYEDKSLAVRLLHLSQAALAGSLVAMNIAIYYRGDECIPTATTLCMVANICEGVYTGIMLTGWGASEFAKKSSEVLQELPEKIGTVELVDPTDTVIDINQG